MWYPEESAKDQHYFGWGYVIDQVGQLRLIDYDCCCNGMWDPDAVATRSTNQKDKNGKEVFEKDILATEDRSSIGMLYKNGPMFDIQWVKVKVDGGWPTEADLEVIGNYFETPELLNVSSEGAKD